MTAVAVLGLGFTYAAVPLYRLFCQATGFAGEVGVDTDPEYIAQMEAVNDRPIKIKFNADTGATMYVVKLYCTALLHCCRLCTAKEVSAKERCDAFSCLGSLKPKD